MANDWTKRFQVNTRAFPAQWDKYGPSAGPIRNQRMIDEGKPDLGLAFLRTDLPCKGTRDMIERLEDAGIPVIIVSSSGDRQESLFPDRI